MIIEITDGKDLEQVAGGAVNNDREARRAEFAARRASLQAGGPGVTVRIRFDADGNEIGRRLSRTGNNPSSGVPASAALGLPN